MLGLVEFSKAYVSMIRGDELPEEAKLLLSETPKVLAIAENIEQNQTEVEVTNKQVA